jgi:hypothetical protein
MTSHRQLVRASKLMDGYDVADACARHRDLLCPIYWDQEFAWNAGGPQHPIAASLALDGMPARWPRPRRTPVAR